MSRPVTMAGTAWAVLALPSAIEAREGRALADFGPHGAPLVRLEEGDAAALRSERGPSPILRDRMHQLEIRASCDGRAFAVNPELDRCVERVIPTAYPVAPVAAPR